MDHHLSPITSPSMVKTSPPFKDERSALVREGSLRIFAAFSQNNWEDYNLQPALEAFGEVIRYDWNPRYDQYDPQWHWNGKQKMNIELLDAVHKTHGENPIDLFFGYLSGRLIFPAPIRTITMMGIPTLNISLDDKTKFFGELEPTGFTGMADIAGAFSLCWTTDKEALRHYTAVGAPAVYMPPGANPFIFHPFEQQRDIDVCFVGQNYGQRPHIISKLREQGIHVHTFGSGWESGELPIDEMVKLFSRSKITLGIGTVGDASDILCIKGRDFEVPMSGGLYLTRYNPDLEEFFEIGKEILCYDNMDDLIEKIRYFLSNPNEGEAIRTAGLQRSLRDHTWVQRFHTAFQAMGMIDENWEPPKTGKKRKETIGKDLVNTKDDWTYYLRVGDPLKSKKEYIKDFVLSKRDIQFMLDVGCNTGEISEQFIFEEIQVLGLDASDNLRLRDGYPFRKCDISESNEIIINDCTLFLSLYHHFLSGKGKDLADELFYKLLLRTRYLIFDTGHVHEQGSDRQHWINAQRIHFSSEDELLDHFSIPYRIIGQWETGGANRSIAVFEKIEWDEKIEVIDEYRRKIGTNKQNEGLISLRETPSDQTLFERTHFYKLKLNDKYFFAKKHLDKAWEKSELENIVEVYKIFPKEELLTFYGVSERFGLIYEWADNFKYIRKLRDERVHGILLQDADQIEMEGQIKYIDFWSSPAKKKMNKDSQTQDQNVQALRRKGENCLTTGDMENAKRCFEAILELDPQNHEALNKLGVTAFQMGKIEKAIPCFSQVISLNENHVEAGQNLAECLEKIGDYQGALRIYQKMVELGGKTPLLLNKIGNCYIQLEDLNQASKAYDDSLQIDGSQNEIREILNGIEQIEKAKSSDILPSPSITI